MRRDALLCLTVLVTSLLSLPTASADWHSFWARVKVDWHRNNAWPEPFRYSDRQSVYAAFAAQTAKGWQVQNTIGDVHFDPESNKLTRAGVSHVYSVLVNSPPQRRIVFVQQAFDEEITEKRLDEVQQTIARLMPGRAMPEVVRTENAPATGKATYPNMIHEKFQQAIVSPVLPAASSSSSSSSGSGQ